MDIPLIVSHSSRAAILNCTVVMTATEVNLDSISSLAVEHTVCVYVWCVCACVCVCMYACVCMRMCVCVVCIQGEGATPVCTVVTTVIGNQIVAVVSDQDMDYKWLVDGQSTPKLSVKASHKISRNKAQSYPWHCRFC